MKAMSDPSGLRFRTARPGDAHAIARLHAGRWTGHPPPVCSCGSWSRKLRAQAFYGARGGTRVEHDDVPPPGGDPARLNGKPMGLRYVWPDESKLL